MQWRTCSAPIFGRSDHPLQCYPSGSSPSDTKPVDGYHFISALFDIEPDEDRASVSLGRGRPLALWLRSQFEGRGYAVEDVFHEDWGWCVMCQSKPFKLWIGCGAVDAVNGESGGLVPPEGSIVWHCFSVVEVSWLARVLGRVDTAAAMRRLDADLRDVLDSHPADIRLVDGER